MTTILFVLTLLLDISNSISTISDIWIDDFLFDINGINGWNNNKITIGATTNYHGWYNINPNTNNIPSLSRQFTCTNRSNIKISFSIYYQCDIKPYNGIKLYLNNNEELYIQYNNNKYKPYTVYNYNLQELQTCRSELFQAQNINYTINTIINALETFNIDFIFALSDVDTFISISNIIIECKSTETETLSPTLEPTIEPTETYPETIVGMFEYNTTLSPTIEPTNPILISTVLAIDNSDKHNELEYILNWWKNSDNMGWKVFIIVSILCSMIGCIVITCIIGYFTGKHKPKRKLKYKRKSKSKSKSKPKSIQYMKAKEKESKNNNINLNNKIEYNNYTNNYTNNKDININIDNDYEYKYNKNKLIQTQLEIKNENENKIKKQKRNRYETENNLQINEIIESNSKLQIDEDNINNISLSYSGNISVSPININHNPNINNNIQNKKDLKNNEFNSFYALPMHNNNNNNKIINLRSKISNRLVQKSYQSNATSNSSNSLSSSYSSECDSVSSESSNSTFPTQTETECTYLKSEINNKQINEEKKFQIDNIKSSVTTNMTNITNVTNVTTISGISQDTYSESDISKTVTQSDYREYQLTNQIINTNNINQNNNTQKKNKILYFNSYNDDMELVEKDEYVQTETEMSGELDEQYHNQW